MSEKEYAIAQDIEIKMAVGERPTTIYRNAGLSRDYAVEIMTDPTRQPPLHTPPWAKAIGEPYIAERDVTPWRRSDG